MQQDELQVSLKKLEEELQRNEYKNLYLFFGVEKNLKNVYKNMIIESALGEAERDMNLVVLNKDSYNASEAENSIISAPFFSEKRILVLDEVNIFSRDELNDYLTNIPDETIVIVLEESKTKTQKGKKSDDEEEVTDGAFDLTKLKAHKNVKDRFTQINFDKATEGIISAKVLSICEENGITMNRNVLNYLVERAGTDLTTLENETKKLCAYAMNKKEITKEDVTLLVSEKLEETVFSLIEDMTQKNMTGVQNKYKALLAAGNDERAIMPLIAWQYSLIFEVKLALEEKKTILEICNATGQKEYPVKKAESVARKMTLEKLKNIVKMCNETTMDFYKGEVNLDLLIDKIMAS